MREDKQINPTPKNLIEKPWFWPAVYAGVALLIIAFILLYNAFAQPEKPSDLTQPVSDPNPVIETNTAKENMKYPFDEKSLNNAKIVQDFYDMTADAEARENALLVFNQTYQTSNGLSISINSEPFEVLAAMSGEVKEVKLDAFTGNAITIEHANGMTTQYSSIKDILVKQGDKVTQGEPIATSSDNEWNPKAGIHLHFEVKKEGEYINPRSMLAF